MSDLTHPPRFAVFGQPITHSLSPRIHRHFAQGLGIALDYQAIEAAPEQFPATLARFAEHGGVGANVTLPLKEQAAGLCLELSPAARRCGAVNTLVRRDDGWFGDNTDGIGLVRDLEVHLGLALSQRQVLLLGAGGAARGVVPALFEAGIAELVVANRSVERARALAHDLAACGPIQVCDWQELDQAGAFDLVLNATSAARQGVALALPPSLLTAESCAYDLSYGDSARPFMEWAMQHGAGRVSDGLGMLVEQAGQAFLVWHGLRPDSAATLAWLREP